MLSQLRKAVEENGRIESHVRKRKVKQAVGEDKWFMYHDILRGNPGTVPGNDEIGRLEYNIGKFEKALLTAERREIKNQRKERVEAAAAAHFDETRLKAESVKRQIRDQTETLSVCPYCEGPLDNPCADHIYPVSRGGLSTRDNMVYVCFSCNSTKSNKTLREFVTKNNLDWVRVERNLKTLGKYF